MKRPSVKFLAFEKDAQQNKIPLTKAFSRVLSSGWYILGREVLEFEENFADYLGVKYCIGVGNGLEALQISLMSLGIKAGDEVITTPISAVATTLAILAVGAKPVFVDTTEEGLIDPDQIEKVLTKKTKAILPVHLYGQSVDLKRLQNICRKNKLFLIEDACQAHGSTFRGKRLGSFGNLSCFSFYPTKNLGALGDGGMIATNDKKLAEICREIRDYGQSGKYLHTRLGLNSRLDELQAALLNFKLKSLDKNNNIRRNLAKRYIKNLSKINLEIVTKNVEGNFHQFVIKTDKREKLQKFLKDTGIPTLIHYPITIPDQPFLKDEYQKNNLPVARAFSIKTLSLPCHPFLSLKEVDFICQKITEALISK